MDVEFHQLDLRLEHLRARSFQWQRRLLSSLAEVGQQTPIVVVAVADEANRYVVPPVRSLAYSEARAFTKNAKLALTLRLATF